MELPICPVCNSRITALRGQYFHKNIPVDLFYCLDCESFSSPMSKPLARGSALSWHLSVEARNLGYADQLFASLGIAAPIVLDIGCGSGTLIKKAQMLGGGGTGFDVDKESVDHGRSLGLDLRAELWSLEVNVPRPSLITCIMVLEHLHQPRTLLHELVQSAKWYKAPLFVSVPWFERYWWHYLVQPLTKAAFIHCVTRQTM